MSKKYEELEFTDAFMFAKIMYSRPDLCKELLELILQKPLWKIEYPSYERAIEMRPDSRGVRLDVYTMDEEQNVYDIEMQVLQESNLAKRSRYYHSMIDLDLLEKGEDYSHLPKTYVIFICKEKPANGYSLPIYTFRYQCQEDSETYLEDGAWTIFVNAEYEDSGFSEELKNFLAFIRTGEALNPASGIAGKLSDAVKTARRNRQWRADYMTYEQELKHQFFLGKEEGRKEGREEGREEGLREAIICLLKEDVITVEAASSKFGIPEEELRRLL